MKIEIEQRIYCPNPEYGGYQDLVDCQECDCHDGIDGDFVKCRFRGDPQ